jgi:hypothetical protein
MWPVFVAFPVCGLAAMLFGPNRFIVAIGFVAFFWPFSIPARVIVASWNKAKKLMQPTWVGLDDGVLYFHASDGGGTKLPLTQVRRIDSRGDFYVFETRMFNFALVPVDAFTQEDRLAFEAEIRQSGGDAC